MEEAISNLGVTGPAEIGISHELLCEGMGDRRSLCSTLVSKQSSGSAHTSTKSMTKKIDFLTVQELLAILCAYVAFQSVHSKTCFSKEMDSGFI
jgi:hypothetical protein